MEKQNEKEQL